MVKAKNKTTLLRSSIELRQDSTEIRQEFFAKAFVTMSEVDYDLDMWRQEVDQPLPGATR